ncbi:hypothetical protein QBC44DRAFT_384841 [Cladorrhinum sp. PSN332]|nr:hypothetical protein QBC44DRAFT_384841 [Cladorrhinum sp. PSN332]
MAGDLYWREWLQQDHNRDVVTFDDLTNAFFKKDDYKINIYMVADASFVTPSDRPTGDWFDGNVRLLNIVHTGTNPFSQSNEEFTLCIVGSSDLTSESDFLQVASWDGRTFRFYQRGSIGWNYFGNALDAFGANAYLGPFNGHVNGSVIMKELHEPWIHWYNPSSANDFTACFSEAQRQAFLAAPYITQPSSKPRLLSALTTGPDVLERHIETAVNNLFNQRLTNDFFVDSTRAKLLDSPSHLPRWVAHLLLTTTINMVAAEMDPGGTSFQIPRNHFYNDELLSDAYLGQLLQGVDTPTLQASISLAEYQIVVDRLGLSMLQQVDLNPKGTPPPDDYLELPLGALGGDQREISGDALGFRIISKNSEGQAPFNILQPSYEDTKGATNVQMLRKKGPKKWLGLLSQTAFNAIMMVDFWNPVYSWKRAVLMLYVPQHTTWDGTNFDLEAAFIQNVNNSSFVQAGITDSPEYQFLELLKVDLAEHQRKVTAYFQAIEVRLRGEDRTEAIADYFKLAESRRRIYRPLPLDEFGPTMPYALKIPYGSPMLEMKPDGTIQEMPSRGQDFLQKWTKSLAGVNPEIIPSIVKSNGPVSVAGLPRPSLLALPCQDGLKSTTSAKVLASRGCPYAIGSLRRQGKKAVCPVNSFSLASDTAGPNFRGLSLESARAIKTPSWKDNILPLLAEPYWIPAEQRKEKGSEWIGAMKYWGKWDLGNYDDVVHRAVSIYRHLRSKSMPITKDPNDYWPEEALETFRLWANTGFPLDSTAAATPKMVISEPVDPPPTYRVRRDIMSLSAEELAVYQSKLDDILQPGQLGSKWQELGLLHAEWCLHYQEATFLWHRAFLLHVEELIDFPIPYWNGFSKDSTDIQSPYAGVPRVFFEETYIHPKDGSVRPNPLKYALSLNGISKTPSNRYVTRDAILAEGPTNPQWTEKINLFTLYHEQITHALSQSAFTSTTTPGTAALFGIPRADITTSSEKQDDSLYPSFRFDFDGLFEQVNDNFHGWVGPDMADNTYTAFDPIFLSYHGNMDRLAGIFMDSNPSYQFTSRFPLQPFIEDGKKLSYDDPRRWIYATIGDMAKDTRALGYMYALPSSADVFTPVESAVSAQTAAGVIPAGGSRAVFLPAAPVAAEETSPSQKKEKTPYVVFLGVGCTTTTYRIDVFTSDAASLQPDPVRNPDYLGQITRLAMGPGRPGGGEGNISVRRCRKPEATRVLSAGKVAAKLSAMVDDNKGKAVELVQIVVSDLETGKVLEKGEYEHLDGFEARVVWLAA